MARILLARVREVKADGGTLADVLGDEYSPRRAHRLRRRLIEATKTARAADAPALRRWARHVEPHAGGGVVPWWYRPDLELDRQRYVWDPPDLVEQLQWAKDHPEPDE